MYRNCFALFLVCGLGMLVESAHGRSGPGIKYIENKNQWPEEVDFSARVPGGRMFVAPGRFLYHFLDEGRIEQLHLHSHSPTDGEGQSFSDRMINGHTVAVDFIGANTSSIPLSFGKSLEYYNYFLGSDSCKWGSRAYAFEGFIYRSFYNGVDLKVYSEGSNVKYDFIVAPGTDPNIIAFKYDGFETIGVDGGGDLVVGTSVSSLREMKPVAYQFIDGRRVVVPCIY